MSDNPSSTFCCINGKHNRQFLASSRESKPLTTIYRQAFPLYLRYRLDRIEGFQQSHCYESDFLGSLVLLFLDFPSIFYEQQVPSHSWAKLAVEY
jgi:hypothetical protein